MYNFFVRERLKNIGRVAATSGLFLATVLGVDRPPVSAGGGCNVPEKPGEECPHPPVYLTNRFTIEWTGGDDFRVESRTRFLGFLWVTDAGTKEGLSTLQVRCGTLGYQEAEKKIFQSSVRVSVSNPQPGCLIRHKIGGGGA